MNVEVKTMLMTVIALCAILAFQFAILKFSLWPLEERISKVEAGQVKLEAGMAELKQLIINQNKTRPKTTKADPVLFER